MHRPWYIAIEGAIGVGKTTLARQLSDHFGSNLLLEVFEENPFLAKFYESRTRYAFQTQMFFLLSRYRQQQQVARLLGQGALFSDYMFDKDRLFAELNLAGDEWEIYQQIHAALSRQIPKPDLIVYLQADTDVLMGRIAQRDRPYERSMERDYIEALRQGYDRFFLDRSYLPVLAIDTNRLNFVAVPDDFQWIVERLRSALKEGMYQQALPLLEEVRPSEHLLEPGSTLDTYQKFHVELDRIKGFNANMYFNFLRLSEEIGELGSVLANVWRDEAGLAKQGQSEETARQEALAQNRHSLESEIADCMAYLLKLANYAQIDLEKAYLDKMKRNQWRNWQ
jgi:deoxyadenosine/deoxycytidine kinase/NTP pyrophosphatase (non-canonical NTP hydrolase)